MDIEKVLSNNRTSQAAIGVPKEVFEKLVEPFENGLKSCTKKNPYRGGRPDVFKKSREKLFFILYFIKNYPTYDVLGMHFGIHRSNAYRKVQSYFKALEIALKKSKDLPAESFSQLNRTLKDMELVIIDGTEQRKNRPKDSIKQKEYYSGKKNTTQ
jgi:hypothetical protein